MKIKVEKCPGCETLYRTNTYHRCIRCSHPGPFNILEYTLKPCPLCESTTLGYSSNGGCNTYTVHCSKCGISLVEYGWGADAENALLHKWNKRVGDDTTGMVEIEGKKKIE